MVDLKGKRWLIPLLAGILTFLLAFLPTFISEHSDPSRIYLYWLFGYGMRIQGGEITDQDFFNEGLYVASGMMYFLIILLCGIFLVVSAILTMKGRNIKYLGALWLLIGIFLLLLPTLYRTSFHVIGEIIDHSYAPLFEQDFDFLFLLPPIIGFLSVISGVKELAR